MSETVGGDRRRSQRREFAREAGGERSWEKKRGKEGDARRVWVWGSVPRGIAESVGLGWKEPKEPRSRRIRSHDIPDT